MTGISITLSVVSFVLFVALFFKGKQQRYIERKLADSYIRNAKQSKAIDGLIAIMEKGHWHKDRRLQKRGLWPAKAETKKSIKTLG